MAEREVVYRLTVRDADDVEQRLRQFGDKLKQSEERATAAAEAEARRRMRKSADLINETAGQAKAARDKDAAGEKASNAQRDKEAERLHRRHRQR